MHEIPSNMKTDNKRFIAGFNGGYLMAKYCSDLAALLANSVKQSLEYLDGFREGISVYEQERQQEYLNEIEQLRADNDDRSEDLEI